jgi:hypothetical protein
VSTVFIYLLNDPSISNKNKFQPFALKYQLFLILPPCHSFSPNFTPPFEKRKERFSAAKKNKKQPITVLW